MFQDITTVESPRSTTLLVILTPENLSTSLSLEVLRQPIRLRDRVRGSFIVESEADPQSMYIINSSSSMPAPQKRFEDAWTLTSSSTWMYGVTDTDSDSLGIIGAYVFYEFPGGSYPSSTTFMALWLGLTTNKGYFMQATVAWGSVNCNQIAQNPPIFSIGYGTHLSNCPIAKVTQGDQYTLQINWDNLVTGYWYIEIYDETAQKTITYTSVGNANQGTYIPCCDMGVILEASQGVDGTYIPNSNQGLYNFLYWDTYGYNHNWVSWQYYKSSNPSPPSNINIKVNQPSGYISSVFWCKSGTTCPT